MHTTEASGTGSGVGSLAGIHWLGIVAAGVSAVVHLRLGLGNLPSPLGVSFLLSGGGFLGGVALVAVGYRRRTVYAIGVPFTLVQILAWFWLNFADGTKSFPADVGTLGGIDKLAQVVLLGVLAVLLGGDP